MSFDGMKSNNKCLANSNFILTYCFLPTVLVALIAIGCKDINYVIPTTYKPVDIYVAGAKKNGGDTAWSATYWKNGVPTSLTNGLVNSSLFSIAVTDSGIYVAGYEGLNLKYWRNGIGICMGDSSRAKAMSVVHSDVYIAGWTRSNTAVYWKNGLQNILSPHAAATAIAVSGNDIFLAGYKGSTDLTTSAVWKTGALLTDPQGNGEINSIVVSGTDVYDAGSYLALASQIPRVCYWKNSTLILLTDASHVGSANSI